MALIDSFLSSALFTQPIDVVLYTALLWVGWIPIFVVFVWGCLQLWQQSRQEQFAGTLKHVLLAVDVPAMTEQTPKAIENMLTLLHGSRSNFTWKELWWIGKFHPTFSLEIASNGGYTQFYVRTQPKYRDVIEAGIYAQYPEAQITEVEDYTNFLPEHFPSDEYDVWGSELRAKEPSIFPIKTYVDFEDRLSQDLKDPLANTLEQLGIMRPGEHFWIQFLLQAADNSWKKKAAEFIDKTFGKEPKAAGGRSILDKALAGTFYLPGELLNELFDFNGDGHVDKKDDPFLAFRITPLQKEQIEAVARKSSKIGYEVKIRMVYAAKKSVYNKGARVTMVKGILNQYSNLNLNGLGLYGPTTPKDDYFWQAWSYTKKQTTLVKAYKSRSFGLGNNPMILNVEEIASLWHFPMVNVRAPMLRKIDAKRAEPPISLPFTDLEDTLPHYAPSFEDSSDHLPHDGGGLAEEPPLNLPGAMIDDHHQHGSHETPAIKLPH